MERSQPSRRLLIAALFIPAFFVTAATAGQVANTTADPDGLNARESLMVSYSNQGNEAEFTNQLLWIVEYHPDEPAARMVFYGTRPAQILATDNDPRLKAAWERALALHSDSADVLFNAGLFLERRDPERALSLLVQAKSISGRDDHEHFLSAIALIYSAALMPGSRVNGIQMSAEVANTLRSEIETSTDAALLSKVGTALVTFNQDQAGLSLIERAIELDPNNPKWREALDSAQAEPVRRANLQAIYRELGQR